MCQKTLVSCIVYLSVSSDICMKDPHASNKLTSLLFLKILILEIAVPPPKAHDHTYIRVEREEDDK